MEDSTLLVGIITITITIFIDIINRIKNIKDNEPQLSFELRNFNEILFLIIKNTGHTKATNIKINIKKIWNNGDNILSEDFIFSIPFELNSNEKTQGKIAIFNKNIVNQVFPYIDIEVSYNKKHFIKNVKYERQVFFNPEQQDKNIIMLYEQMQLLNKNIDKWQSPVLRLANYFDGHQISQLDEIDFITNKTFQNDLYDAIIEKKKEEITSREDTIKKRLR